MEIILIKDVENLGKANSLVDVKPGYARNYLIPFGYAIIANKANKNTLMQHIRQREEEAARELAELQALAAKLKETTLRIAAKAGASGKIFGSVTDVQIVNALQEQFNISIERKRISLAEEVKTLGRYTADLNLHKEVQAKVDFEVYNDDKESAQPEATETTEDADA